MLTVAMESLRQQKTVLRFANAWKITRTDGVILRFTDHDTELLIPENGIDQTYSPVGGFSSSDRRKVLGFSPQDAEVVGILSSGLITDEDLLAGRYREAEIEELVVDWLFPWAGTFERAVHTVVETTHTNETWICRFEGKSRWLKQPIGDVYTRNCRYILGDARCLFDLDETSPQPFKETTTVSSVPDANKNFVGLGITQATGFFGLGLITWNTGANAGILSEAKTHIEVFGDAAFLLWNETPFPIQVGDSFTVTAGCDKTLATCRDKFDNLVNHGGFPSIPGTDEMIKSPNAKRKS